MPGAELKIGNLRYRYFYITDKMSMKEYQTEILPFQSISKNYKILGVHVFEKSPPLFNRRQLQSSCSTLLIQHIVNFKFNQQRKGLLGVCFCLAKEEQVTAI